MSQVAKLLWSHDFKSTQNSSLDPQIWNTDRGDGSHIGLVGWGNHEREFYTDAAITVDGALKISARREPVNSSIQTYYGPAEWTSGKIHTANKVGFTFGRLEIRAKMPSGKGTWPALWLLGTSLLEGTPWPQCGEIDIFEGTGAHPYQVQGTIHGPEYYGEAGVTKIIQSPELLADAFHTYSINWSPNTIEWLFDDAVYNVINRGDASLQGKLWPFNEEFYLIINLAMGGWFAGDIEPTLDSAELEIESIKYYSIDGIGAVHIH